MLHMVVDGSTQSTCSKLNVCVIHVMCGTHTYTYMYVTRDTYMYVKLHVQCGTGT
jgi:hypothetical protein